MENEHKNEKGYKPPREITAKNAKEIKKKSYEHKTIDLPNKEIDGMPHCDCIGAKKSGSASVKERKKKKGKNIQVSPLHLCLSRSHWKSISNFCFFIWICKFTPYSLSHPCHAGLQYTFDSKSSSKYYFLYLLTITSFTITVRWLPITSSHGAQQVLQSKSTSNKSFCNKLFHCNLVLLLINFLLFLP